MADVWTVNVPLAESDPELNEEDDGMPILVEDIGEEGDDEKDEGEDARVYKECKNSKDASAMRAGKGFTEFF